MDKEQLKVFLGTEELTIVEAMQRIDANTHGILFVVDGDGRILGSVTDGDIRRWIIKTGKLNACLKEVMNKNPRTIYSKEKKNAVKYMEKQHIQALPVVDAKGRVENIILASEKKIEEENLNKKALDKVPVIIMAGGKGTRLYPYTKILPKPLVPIGDIPIMERIIDKFRDFGVSDFYVTVNYRKNMIKSYFSEMMPDYSIQYVEEEKPLGTAGSLKLLEKNFTMPFIVTNCDILIHGNYADIYRHHIESGKLLTVVAALKNIVVPYGVLHAKENGTLISMEEKPKLSYFVNTGMYVLSPEILEKIPEDTFFHMTDLIDVLLKEGECVGMYPISEDSFLDMGEFEEMRRMEKKLDLKAE